MNCEHVRLRGSDANDKLVARGRKTLIYIKVQTDIGTDLFWFGCDVRAALSPQKTPASTIVEIFSSHDTLCQFLAKNALSRS